MDKPSPLLHGYITNTPLDLITKRLYFIWPLTDKQVEWLNTIIYKDDIFWINYWSLTHLVWGSILSKTNLFSLWSMIIIHTIFEIWELWAGGYLDGTFPLDFPEFVDCVMDTLFAIAGYILIEKLF